VTVEEYMYILEKEGGRMTFQIGDTWFGKNGTTYEGIQATIDDITSRYVQVSFSPGFDNGEGISFGKPLGKRYFVQHFSPSYQLTIFDV